MILGRNFEIIYFDSLNLMGFDFPAVSHDGRNQFLITCQHKKNTYLKWKLLVLEIISTLFISVDNSDCSIKGT